MSKLTEFFTPEQRQRFAELPEETRRKIASILAKRAVYRLDPARAPEIFRAATPSEK